MAIKGWLNLRQSSWIVGRRLVGVDVSMYDRHEVNHIRLLLFLASSFLFVLWEHKNYITVCVLDTTANTQLYIFWETRLT